MNLPEQSGGPRHTRLVAEIARQRIDLAGAYHNLEKPIHYAEYGLRGFGFLRQHTWVFVAVPAVLKIGSLLLGIRKGAPVRPASAPSQRQNIETARQPKGFTGHALKWGALGWRLFKIYRRVRTYLP